MNIVQVALGQESYAIQIGERLLLNAGELLDPVLPAKRVIIVSDATVAKLYLHRLTNALDAAGITNRSIVVPAGESSKSYGQFSDLLEQILEQKPDRRTSIIALGGGVIGDLAGFAASVTLRGLPFIQIPTSLLAMVDSAVGGKTGINSAFGKNLIGAFYQPKAVLTDISVLGSLPERELKAGYAEIIKYGLIDNPEFFAWLEKNGAKLLSGDHQALTYAIEKSCQAKAAIVAEDEKEQGRRALLNLGHTFGHALETMLHYDGRLLHGEAVAIGMMLAFELSVALGICPVADLARLRAHYTELQLPASPLAAHKEWDVEALMHSFARDKKAYEGKLTFILVRGIGQAFIANEVEPEAVKQVLSQALKR